MYTIKIKNKNTGVVLRTLNSSGVTGKNSIIWDGKDNSGNYVDAGEYSATLELRNGEYHFILIDVETIYNGITIKSEENGNSTIYYDYKDLVLGAWGCGAFGHNPYRVANYFYQLLFEEGYRFCFEYIIFAIYDKGEKKNFNAFSEVFWNVSAKLSLDYDYGDQTFAEIYATSASFYQNVFPHINFNFSAENFDEKNIGYAHGIMKNGLPFTAELWEYENVRNVAFYLPLIENFFEDEKIEKNDSDKITGFSFDEEVKGFHSLCVGMLETYSVASHKILDKYIDMLIECDLLKFKTNMRNGYGFILQDSADNEFFCFTVSLQHEGEETAFTPLKWIPFKQNKTSEFRLIK